MYNKNNGTTALRSRMRIMLIAAAAAALMVGAVVSKADPREAVEIQFLSISDWHAQLDPLFIFPIGS
ncbi:MAG: hypothetical protein IIA98_09335, partial [Proteobacteria bacterium]|nr:hypothetical protein [Pseudomonadota bacterium]